MMNIIEIQDNLKNFSEDQLVKEMQVPTGSVPQYLILSEINRRKRVRDSYQQQQDQQGADQTVAQEKLSAAGVPAEGIAGLAQALAPKTDMMQNTGVDPQQQMPMPDAPPPMAEAMPPMMGEEMPPEMGGGVMSMAEGGSVKRMAVGGASTNYTGQGGTLPAFLNNTQSSLASDPALQVMAERVGMSVEEYIAQMDPRSRAQNLLRVSGNAGGFDKAADDALIEGLNPPLPSQEDLDLRYASDARNEAVGIGTSDRMLSPPPSGVFDSNATPIASVMQDNIPEDVGQLGTPLADLLSLDPSGIAELPDSQTGRTAGRINKAVPFDARSTSLGYNPLFEAIGVGVGEGTPTSKDLSYDNINVAGPPSLGFLSPLQQAARAEQFKDNIPSNDMPSERSMSPLARFGGMQPPNLKDLALTYDQLINKSKSGNLVTEEDLVASVEAGLLNDQQAADINSIIADPSYTLTASEQAAANLARTNVMSGPPDGRMVTLGPLGKGIVDAARADFQGAKRQVTDTGKLIGNTGNIIGDFAAGMFGGRTIGEQQRIDDSRAAELLARQVNAAPKSLVQPNTEERKMGEALYVEPSNDPDSFRTDKPNLPFSVINPVEETDPASKRSSTSGGGYSSVESELIDMLKQREKRAENDKWMALAKAGMAMMASKQPSLLGAAGEAGMVGLEALEESKADYEATKMSLLAMRQKIAASRASRSSKSGLSYGNLTDIYETLQKEGNELAIKIDEAGELGFGNTEIMKRKLVQNQLELNRVKGLLLGAANQNTPIADLADKQSTQYPIAQ